MDNAQAIKVAMDLADDLTARLEDEDNDNYIEQADEVVSTREDIAVLTYLAHMVRGGHTAQEGIAHLVSLWADIDGKGWN